MRTSKTFLFIGMMLLSILAWGQAQPLVISTNNTPLDRKTLELVSREAFRRLGVEVQVVNNPSERSLQMANQGEVDGEGLRVAGLNTNYPNLIQVPERFTGISFVAFSKDALIRLDDGWESLKPYRIAFINGWKLFEAYAGDAKIVRKVDQPEQLFRMLDAGHIDLALYTRADGVALIRNLGLHSIAPLSPSLKDVDMYLYLNKRHADLVPRLANVLRAMESDGTYNKVIFSTSAE